MFLSVHNLKIGGILTVDRLDKFHAIAKLGTHTILLYEGMVVSQRAEELKKKLTTKESITIENQEGTRIFTGYPLKAELLVSGQVYKLRVSCISYSFLSDVKTNNKSFQDTDMTFKDVLSEAYSKHDNAGVLFRRKSEVEIGNPLFQHLETEWQLAKRVAALLETVCYPNDLSDSAEIYLGESKKIQELTEYRILDEGFLAEEYFKDSPNNSKTNIEDYYFCKIESHLHYQIGDSVSVSGRKLAVAEKELLLVILTSN